MTELLRADLPTLRANLAKVQDQIAAACARANRDPGEVRILVAAKYIATDQLELLRAAGVTLLGENRLQQLEEHQRAAPDGFEWHFIGALQSRKIAQIVARVSLIHSVASESAMARLKRHAADRSGCEILIQVNVAGEAGKSGIRPEELPRYLEDAPLPVRGLMTMPPAVSDAELNRQHFARLAQTAREHQLSELSMGTSQDFTVAVEEGATIVRLGGILFR